MNDADKNRNDEQRTGGASLNEETLIACQNAAVAMIAAMEAQNECRTVCAQTAAKLDMGLPVEESAQKIYREKNDAAKHAVETYRDSHILAHRTACAEQLMQYREKDSVTLLPSAPFTYNRDPVDATIAQEAMSRWAETGIKNPGKNYLLVGTFAPAHTITQLFVSNTHSPIPIKEAVSKQVKVAYGEPVYGTLNPEIGEYQNEWQPVTPTKKAAPKVVAEPEKEAERETPERLQKPKRFTRVYQDTPTPHRKRTAVVADILFEEKAKKGVRLSPDPAKMPSKEKKREMTAGISSGK